MSELKPCPWQMPDEGVHDVRVYDVDEGDSGTIGFTVSCNDCLIDGPQAMAKKRAVELWNRRASPWVRVEDGLPEIGQEVVVNCHDFYLHKNHKSIAFWDGLYWRRDNGVTFPYDEGQHWMPIPKLTEEE